MSKYYFVLVLSCLFLVNAEHKARHLPDYIKPCSRSSPELTKCAKEHAKKAIPALLKGDKKFKSPYLLPLHLEKVELRPSDQLELILTNIYLHGLDTMEFKDMKFDFVKNHMDVVLWAKWLSIDCQYEVKGQILILPISGNGPANFTFHSSEFKYSFDYDLVKKSDGKEYISNIRPSITFDIKQIFLNLENLFNGNKELGDQMNKFLNENGIEVLKDLGKSISTIIETIASRVISSFMKVIPFDEIFLP